MYLSLMVWPPLVFYSFAISLPSWALNPFILDLTFSDVVSKFCVSFIFMLPFCVIIRVNVLEAGKFF